MVALFDWIDHLFQTPNHQMAWGRIPPEHVVGVPQPKPFAANEDYVVVRLSSMFLRQSRVLWLKFSPLAHAEVTQAGRKQQRSEMAVIGPAQFGDLATAPIERSIILNQRLSGPAVWRGGDLQVAAGLFAVPRDQAASALIQTVGQLSSLAIPGLQPSLEIAKIMKSGVESLLGLSGTKPVLAIKNALGDPASVPAGTEASPCVLAAIAAPVADVDFSKLWIREGRLWQGSSPAALTPYEDHDHLLITVESGAPREDWRGLPKLLAHESIFDAVLRATGLTQSETSQRLNDAFSAFDGDLIAEEELTDPDKNRVRGVMIAELQKRLDGKFAGPFGAPTAAERRSATGEAERVNPDGFDFLDVRSNELEGAPPAPAGTLPFPA
jgi:hypothetical protein